MSNGAEKLALGIDPSGGGDALDDMAKACEKMRVDALFGVDDSGNDEIQRLAPIAEQHYLLGLAALETAQRHLKLASYYAMRGE